MKIKKIGLIKGVSQYDVMRSWCDELEKGFNKLGIEVVVYDKKYHSFTAYHEDIDVFIGFNGWGIPDEATANFRNKPFVMVLADHANEHLDRIKNLNENDILTVMDKYDANVLSMIGHINEVYFLPHAAVEVANEKYDKIIDCLFLGSYSDPDTFLNKLKDLNSPGILALATDIIEQCLKNSTINHIEKSYEMLKTFGVNISLYEDTSMIYMINIIGRYLYSTKRINTLKELADNGINLTIYGNNWENSDLYIHDNIRFNKSVNYWQSQDLIKLAKITLNIQSLLVDGSHERVYAAMANDSISLSNTTNYLSEEFLDNKEILLYNSESLSDIIPRLNDLIIDEGAREEITSRAKQKIINTHTYQHRAKTIIEIIEHKLSNFTKSPQKIIIGT